jgi:DNA-binding NarL/FixJ family response regulator
MMTPIPVVVAEDHPLFRKGLVDVLRSSKGFEVVGEAGDGATALELLRTLRPRIALLDIEMPQVTGFGVAEAAAREGLDAALVFLTMYKDAAMMRRALALGAQGYVLKDGAVEEIVACLEAVAAGRVFVSGAISGHSEGPGVLEAVPALLARLTPAERGVLALIAQDRTSAEIAVALGIRPKTVDNHRSHICQKLGLRGPQALLRFALAHRDQLTSGDRPPPET